MALTYQITSTQKAEPTKTYVIRVGTVDVPGATFTQIYSETATQTFTWNASEYVTWTFDSPLLLSANTEYGIDVGMTSSTSAWQTGIPYINGDDKSKEDSQEKVDYSELIIISLSIGAVILSALSIYHLNKKTNLFNFKHKKIKKISKKPTKSSQRAKNIISEFDNKDLHLLFESERIPENFSFLKNIDLTILSDEFLNKVDKLGFKDDEKADFLKEMLYFTQEERNNIIKDILGKIKSSKIAK